MRCRGRLRCLCPRQSQGRTKNKSMRTSLRCCWNGKWGQVVFVRRQRSQISASLTASYQFTCQFLTIRYFRYHFCVYDIFCCCMLLRGHPAYEFPNHVVLRMYVKTVDTSRNIVPPVLEIASGSGRKQINFRRYVDGETICHCPWIFKS